MVTMRAIEDQLQRINSPIKYWGRAELRELQHILVEDEQIQFCLNGRYKGGFALLCVTDRRILLVDRKLFYLTLEDIRYDMISEVDYNYRLLDATIKVCTPNKNLEFTSYKKADLRKMTAFVQSHVMNIRQQVGEPSLQAYMPEGTAIPTQKVPQYAGAASTPLKVASPVAVQNLKTFMPRVPIRRRISQIYTNTPLSTTRNITRD